MEWYPKKLTSLSSLTFIKSTPKKNYFVFENKLCFNSVFDVTLYTQQNDFFFNLKSTY